MALFQNAISANPKIELAMLMPNLEIKFWKTALLKYVHIYTHLFTHQKLFSKNIIIKLDIGIASPFFCNGAERVLEKNFSYI